MPLEPIAIDLAEALARVQGIAVLVGEGKRVTQANDAFLTLIGYTRRDLERGAINWEEVTPPDWRWADESVQPAMFAKGWAGPIEKEYLRRNGTRVRVAVAGITLSYEPFRWLSVVLDLSSLRPPDAPAPEVRAMLQVAEDLETGLRRAALPAVADVDLASVSLPAEQPGTVGGDFLRVFVIDGSTTAVIIGDVCGKGAAAAPRGLEAETALSTVMLRLRDPAEALRWAHEVLALDRTTEYVTALVGFLSWKHDGLDFHFASAGHPGPVLLRDGVGSRVHVDTGSLIGTTQVQVHPQLHSHRLSLRRGDVLMLYTDGISDWRRPPLGEFEVVQWLAQAYERHAGAGLPVVVDRIRQEMLEAISLRVRRDDVTLLAIRPRPLDEVH
jgi:hypothetical protein